MNLNHYVSKLRIVFIDLINGYKLDMCLPNFTVSKFKQESRLFSTQNLVYPPNYTLIQLDLEKYK